MLYLGSNVLVDQLLAIIAPPQEAPLLASLHEPWVESEEKDIIEMGIKVFQRQMLGGC